MRGMGVAANCVDCESNIDEGACVDASHEHAPIYCMPHGMTYGEHEVGAMCIEDGCDKQWFYAPDWSSPECRAACAAEAERRGQTMHEPAKRDPRILLLAIFCFALAAMMIVGMVLYKRGYVDGYADGSQGREMK